MKLNYKAYLLFALIPAALFLFALKASVFSASSSDAIAVKVVPNPNHYSVSRWYELKGIGGAPQMTVVDGYPAIRNGRTIYVNAASVDPSSKTISTNIYLISYNQDQAADTTDILGRIVSHWKFNENLSTTGTCSISSLSCNSDSDCNSGYTCENQRCQLAESKNCLSDADCPTGLYCDSIKSKITRDVKRLGMIEDIKYSLNNYNSDKGNYPALAAGTYIPNLTLSTWPSWNNSLLKSLSLPSSYVDPINRLAACPGHDPVSCWNASTSRFYFPVTASNLEIPQNSYIFVYSATRDGSSYDLCSFMESGAMGYDTSSHELSNHSCKVTGVGDYIDSVVSTVTPPNGGEDLDPTVSFSNHAPQLIDASLQGEENQPFSGYIEVTDEDGDALTWQLDTSANSWSGWSAAPVLKDMAGSPTKKLVYASNAGAAGDYPLALIVSDGRGGIIRANLTIKIKKEVINFAPSIEASDFDYYYSCASTPLKYDFYVIDEEQPVSLTISKVSASPDILSGAVPSKTISGNRADFSISVTPSASLADQDRTFVYKLKACDSLGSCSEKQISIRLHPGANSLNISCASEARLNSSYYCQIGSDSSSCFNNMNLSGAPTGLSLVHSNGEYAISGKPSVLGSFNMALSATDSKGSSNSVNIPLKVNTYCGDGVLQSPNTEGKGGKANNGYEQCDITANVATTVSSSSIDKQYGCVPDGYKVSTSPYPITTNGYCVFGAKNGGYGGYCGDGYCQAQVYSPGTNVLVKMETTSNCAVDCADPNTPQDPAVVCGNGQLDSGELCDGTLFASNSTCASVNAGTPYGELKCSSCSLDTSGCSSTNPNTPVCGDGIVSGNESCDYASFSGKACSSVFSGTSGTLGCYSNCTYNSSNCRCSDGKALCSGVCCSSTQVCTNGSCQTDPGSITPDPSCGDGKINQTWEDCDGSALNGKTCATINSNTPNGTLKCSAYCKYDTSGCSGAVTPGPVCGNGVIEGTEQCDGSNFGGKTCASINAGAPNGSLKCSGCQIDASGCSAPTPTSPVCGNGKIESGEECDGAALGNQTCSGLGFASGSLYCQSNCKFNTVACNFVCPAGTQDGYVYNSFNDKDTQQVTKNVCYRSNGGTWTATATCNAGTVSISNASLACKDGYKNVNGAWYEGQYGCYDVCVLATCSAGTVDGYDYPVLNHKDTKSVTKTIAGGSCTSTVTCSDGTTAISNETCTCTNGVYDANSKSCVGCLSDSDCNTGYKCESKQCVKKCWYFTETTSTFTFYEGDILASYGCSVSQSKDNPHCDDNPKCPSGCNSVGPTKIGTTSGGDSCYDYSGTFGTKKWHDRDIYRCSRNESIQHCYGDACRLTIGSTSFGGTVNSTGACVRNYYCGDGICTSSIGETCSYCPNDCGTCSTGGGGGGHIMLDPAVL